LTDRSSTYILEMREMRATKMMTTLENELVALPPRTRGSAPEILTPKEIKKLPANIVFGSLTVLKKPEPIAKRRVVKKRRHR
jgi:hypothetical protein